jgi:hypothetical protein
MADRILQHLTALRTASRARDVESLNAIWSELSRNEQGEVVGQLLGMLEGANDCTAKWIAVAQNMAANSGVVTSDVIPLIAEIAEEYQTFSLRHMGQRAALEDD